MFRIVILLSFLAFGCAEFSGSTTGTKDNPLDKEVVKPDPHELINLQADRINNNAEEIEKANAEVARINELIKRGGANTNRKFKELENLITMQAESSKESREILASAIQALGEDIRSSISDVKGQVEDAQIETERKLDFIVADYQARLDQQRKEAEEQRKADLRRLNAKEIAKLERKLARTKNYIKRNKIERQLRVLKGEEE